MSERPAHGYRVVVLNVAVDGVGSREDWLRGLEAAFSLPDDARLALAAGRAAVVQVAPDEASARRTATLLIRCGAEVHIEREDGHLGGQPGAPGLSSAAGDPGRQAGSFAAPAAVAPAHGGFEPEPTEPMELEDLRGSVPLRPSSGTTIAAVVPAPELRSLPPGVAGPGPGRAPESEPARGALVRCPTHGLLYDKSVSLGCKRCQEAATPAPAGWRARLRGRRRVWLGLGLAAALLLGAVPSTIYVQARKKGELLERRAEAAAVAASQLSPARRQAEYARAQRRVMALRQRGMGVTAGIWLLFGALGFGLWYRFV